MILMKVACSLMETEWQGLSPHLPIDNIDSVTGIGNLSRDMDIARHIHVAVVLQKKTTKIPKMAKNSHIFDKTETISAKQKYLYTSK